MTVICACFECGALHQLTPQGEPPYCCERRTTPDHQGPYEILRQIVALKSQIRALREKVEGDK